MDACKISPAQRYIFNLYIKHADEYGVTFNNDTENVFHVFQYVKGWSKNG